MTTDAPKITPANIYDAQAMPKILNCHAKVAVGDAELIIPLRASSEKSLIRDRGSIDNSATKELACTILEGSRDAFKKRQQMYGY